MLRIALINMPFARVRSPSLGLAQLKSVVDKQFAGCVVTKILHLNHDFVPFLGEDLYHFVAHGDEAFYSGLGEWLFRSAAFPELRDNADEYWRRYRHHFTRAPFYQGHPLIEARLGIGALLDRLIERYYIATYNLVGFTSMFAQNMASIAMAKHVKQRAASITIVVGGANCESPMGEQIVTNVDAFDFAFSGCALKSFPAFVKCVLENDLNGRHRIDGVFSKANTAVGPSGILASVPVGRLGQEVDIEEDIQVDYEDFLAELESKLPPSRFQPVLPFETSRGCWWGQRAHCTFCGLNGSTIAYRALSPDRAVTRLESLLKFYPRVKRFDAVDNIMPRSYLTDVLPKIRLPEDATVFYEVKPDLSDEDFRVLAKAGVRSVQPGIESFATSTLKLMRKGSTAFQNLLFLKRCVSYGLSPDWNLLIGSPGEETSVYEKYLADLPRLVHLPPPSGVFPVRFDRFSPYFVSPEQYGLQLRPLDFYALVYPFKADSLALLAYYFMDENFDAHYLRDVAQWIEKLRVCVDLWISRWRVPSSQVPMLYVIASEPNCLIYDSRSDEPHVHTLSNSQTEIMRLASSPVRIGDLGERVGSIRQTKLDKDVRDLIELGLLFQENERVMSIVNTAGPVARLSDNSSAPTTRSWVSH